MKKGDESEYVMLTPVRPSYLYLVDTEPEYQRSVSLRTLRHSAHTSRRLLGPKCSKCFNDIDSGTEYWSWAGLLAGQFFWHYTHGRC